MSTLDSEVRAIPMGSPMISLKIISFKDEPSTVEEALGETHRALSRMFTSDGKMRDTPVGGHL